MKSKILSAVAVLAILGSSAYADGDFYVGAAAIDLDGNTGQAVNLGYEGRKVWQNNVMAGAGLDFQIGKADIGENSENILTYTGNIKLGYVPVTDLAIYAIGTGGYQSWSTSGSSDTSGLGFGYGAGIEYTIAKHFAVAAEYKKYSMKFEKTNVSYDYSTAGINLLYRF